nr:immunoglobulin light chain junction region [Macaca mulatta]
CSVWDSSLSTFF